MILVWWETQVGDSMLCRQSDDHCFTLGQSQAHATRQPTPPNSLGSDMNKNGR